MGKELNEKMIEKIKKVLELSRNNPSIEEAKSAALKAQKLMAKYHISMAEIETIENLEDIMEKEVVIGTGNKWKYSLSAIVSKNFRCKFFYRGKSSVVFYGHKKDIEVAAMTFKMLFDVGNKESIKYYQKKRNECLNRGELFSGRGIKNAFLNGYILGIKEVLDKQCTALMIVIPEDVEKKYKSRTSKMHGINIGFKTRIDDEGERAKSEGMIIGKNTIAFKSIETTC